VVDIKKHGQVKQLTIMILMKQNGSVKDTLSGFDRFGIYNYNASITTKIYGIVNFKPKNKVQSIRHTMTPSISYSNNPSFEKYYDTYIIDANGNTAEYTRFQGGLIWRSWKKLF
jgi:hypothetical protein